MQGFKPKNTKSFRLESKDGFRSRINETRLT